MPIEIESVTYLSRSEVAEAAGVSRQTLWRWGRDGKIAGGQRFRDGKVLYSSQEVEAIKEYANRLEPVGSDSEELPLFNLTRG